MTLDQVGHGQHGNSKIVTARKQCNIIPHLFETTAYRKLPYTHHMVLQNGFRVVRNVEAEYIYFFFTCLLKSIRDVVRRLFVA